MPSVLVIDDHPRICKGLSRVLNASGFHADAVTCISEALHELTCREFDVLILDLKLPDIFGLEALPMLKALSKAEIVVLSGFVDVDLTTQCMKAGAFYVLLKPPNLVHLHEVLVSAAEKARDTNHAREHAEIITSGEHDAVAAIRSRLPQIRTAWQLTQREVQILEGLVLGKSNLCLAEELTCSERGIEKHVTSILRKAAASCRAELITRFWLETRRAQ